MAFRKKILLISLFYLIFIPTSGYCQFDGDGSDPIPLDLKPTDVIIWNGVEASVQADGTVEVGLRLETKNNFTIYVSKLEINGPKGTTLVKSILPEVRRQKDPMSDDMVDVYASGDFILTFSTLEVYTAEVFPVSIKFLGCTERICLFPFTQVIELPAYRPSTPNLAAPEKAMSTKLENGTWESKELTQESIAKQLSEGTLPLWLTLLAAFLGGLATNITPCVFPMIPITIRLLARSGGSKTGSLLYAGGIVVTYTAIGSIVGLTGGVFGTLLANPWVNLAFAIVFIGLGLSMLGFADFSKLQTFGTRLGSGKNNKLNTFLMGSGAGLVAAPCTGPILGGLLIYATKLGDPALAISLFFLYSIGFALPYVFLGMLSGKVSTFKVSPKIQVGVKVFFAGVMFALALFYLKTPAHELLKPFAGAWSQIGLTSFIFFCLSSILVSIGFKKLNNKSLQIVPTFFLGIAIFAGSQVLTGSDLTSELVWYKDEASGYEKARELNKPIIVDGWAEWCIACKEMDATVFQDPAIISELQKNWVLVKLDLTNINDTTEALAEKYGMPGLPTLVLIPSDGDLSKSKKIPGAPSAENLMKDLREFIDR